MFDFLGPNWVVVRKSRIAEGFTYLCTHNDHFGAKYAADRFWSKSGALTALREHVVKNSKYYSNEDLERFQVIKDV